MQRGRVKPELLLVQVQDCPGLALQELLAVADVEAAVTVVAVGVEVALEVVEAPTENLDCSYRLAN